MVSTESLNLKYNDLSLNFGGTIFFFFFFYQSAVPFLESELTLPEPEQLPGTSLNPVPNLVGPESAVSESCSGLSK